MVICVFLLLKALVAPNALIPKDLILFEERINVAGAIPVEKGLVSPRKLLHGTSAFGKVVIDRRGHEALWTFLLVQSDIFA